MPETSQRGGDSQPRRHPLGAYPTPLQQVRVPELGPEPIWLKDEGPAAPEYGGNKVRKLEWLLQAALDRGVGRLYTMGGAGSHHALACALYGGKLGLTCSAALFPQPHTPDAELTLRAALGAGLRAEPVRGFGEAVYRLARARGPDTMSIGPGGVGAMSTRAYLLALRELGDQLRERAEPPPETIVVAAGSGGTAAGLLAGVLEAGWETTVVAVQVAPNPALKGCIVAQTAGLVGQTAARAAWHRLRVDGGSLGRGYGYPLAEHRELERLGRAMGVRVDPTYTAKALATARRIARLRATRRPRRLRAARGCLYWHTLSSSSPQPTGRVDAPLPSALAALLVPLR